MFEKNMKNIKNIQTIPEVIIEYLQLGKIDKILLFMEYILRIFGINNDLHHYVNNPHNNINEDRIIGLYGKNILSDLLIAPPSEAIKFAFECDPVNLYELNGNKLPFGCHAWQKYYLLFWKEYIKIP